MSESPADPRFELAGQLTQARLLRHEGRYDEAITHLHELRAELQRAGLRSGLLFEELAESLASSGRSDEAKGYFALAFVELSKDPKFVDKESARLERIARLGDVDSDGHEGTEGSAQ